MSLVDTESVVRLFDRLYPIARSITGPGYRESVQILSEWIPFEVEGVPSGTMAFDWEVPQEWHIRSGVLVDPDGKKLADFTGNNLSVVNYSVPVNIEIGLDDLQRHLHSVPELPDAVPYVTSYYKEDWGFCISHRVRESLKPGLYKAVIDAEFLSGRVEFGRYLLKATEGHDRAPTVLLSSYLCHPSMANNELSGPIILALLHEIIKQWTNRKFNYLFVINPETIGSICFLSRYGNALKSELIGGMVLTCLGGARQRLTYQMSRYGRSGLDRLFSELARQSKCDMRKFDATSGSDERQYCAGAFNLPIGQIARTIYAEYPEYHTSADDRDFVRLDKFVATAREIAGYLEIHEMLTPVNRHQPYCELQLGKRGLYPNLSLPNGSKRSSDSLNDRRQQLNGILNILSYADGNMDLCDIAMETNSDIQILARCAKLLEQESIIYFEE